MLFQVNGISCVSSGQVSWQTDWKIDGQVCHLAPWLWDISRIKGPKLSKIDRRGIADCETRSCPLAVDIQDVHLTKGQPVNLQKTMPF